MIILEVAAAVIQRQSPLNSSATETLAVRRKEGSMRGFWEFPGGKREPGESLAHCLFRELQEELSIEVEVGSELGIHEHNNGKEIIKLHAFLVTRWQGDIILHDHDKMVWLSPSNIGQVQWSPADLPFVEPIKDKRTAL